MAGISPALAVDVSGGNLVLVIIVALIALGAPWRWPTCSATRSLPPAKAPTT